MGRMNASKPLMRLRENKIAGGVVDTDGKMGQPTIATYKDAMGDMPFFSVASRTPRPRSIKGIHPRRSFTMRNVRTPIRSATRGKQPVRNADIRSGNGNVQEANASSRKAPGTHNRLDRAIPIPKGR